MKLLISIPVEPNGSLNVHLVRFLLHIRDEFTNVDIRARIEEGQPTAETRNRQCRYFLRDTDYDVMLCIDSDQVPKIEGIVRMLNAIERDDVDCVNGWTFALTPDGPKPVCYKFGGRTTPLEFELARPREGILEMKDWYVGASAMMVTRAALKKFIDNEKIWFLDLYQGNPEVNFGDRAMGHDAHFFSQCREMGIRCWVDTHKDCCWGHIKKVDLLQWYESK